MTLYDELYFEITVSGKKDHVKTFVNYLKSGELDDFFEFSTDYIYYDDNFAPAAPNQEVSLTLSNEDCGIEIDEFDTDEFLEIICKAGRNLYIKGQLSDSDGDEYTFLSDVGESYYVNARNLAFNEDEDKPRDEEE